MKFSELSDAEEQIHGAQKRVERIIMAVPTGEQRNKLTEVNIHLMMAERLLKEANVE